MPAVGIADQLIHTTVRIETLSPTGAGSGTGFFFDFCKSDASNVPVIVSNKHVIADATSGRIHITIRKPGENEPDLGNHVAVPIADFEKLWVLHPDPDVDLAVFPVAHVWNWLKEQGHDPFYRSADMSLIADKAFMNDLSAVEDIAMIGYPTGLWDAKHNLPIFRRGVTATAPYIDFEGKPLFMIDCACFPGSSGSPVFLFNIGSFVHKNGGTSIGQRVKLMGILFAGPQFTAKGEIRVEPVPTALQPISLSKIPINLGVCVKAEQLRWFETHFQRLASADTALEQPVTAENSASAD